MQIQDVFAAYKSDLQQMEKYLDKYLTSEVRLIPEVAHHLIDSGGKRFRPLLLLISSRLCDYNGDHRFPMAAVMEFIHTASLLHDDVIDQATIRRGKTSANNIWGNAASVLVGDFLYSKAFKLLSEISDIALIKLMSRITNVMSEGEVFQLMKCGDVNITEEEYLNIIEKKTAVCCLRPVPPGLFSVRRRRTGLMLCTNSVITSAWLFRSPTIRWIIWPGSRNSAKQSAKTWKRAK